MIHEIKDDLFNHLDTTLVRCVSQDLKMGLGIAVLFKNHFGYGDLFEQNKQVGEIAVLKNGDHYVIYLITKQNYWNKPTYASLQKTLDQLKLFCDEKHIDQLSMPKIGCGLDKLCWDKVSAMLNDTLPGINIHVYSL